MKDVDGTSKGILDGRGIFQSVDPEDGTATLNLATLLAQVGPFSHAEPLFQRAIELRPQHGLTLTTYARALIKENRPTDAVDLLTEKLHQHRSKQQLLLLVESDTGTTSNTQHTKQLARTTTVLK